MADVNLASLNFDLIIDEKGFDEQVERVKQKAGELNTSISNALDLTRKGGTGFITKEEHQSAMRMLQEEFQAAMNAQKLKLQYSKESQKIATQEAIDAEKISREVEKTNQERAKGVALEQKALEASIKAGQAEIDKAAATSRAAKADADAARAAVQKQTAEINQAAALERQATATNRRLISEHQLTTELERQNRVSLSNSRVWREIKNLSLAYFSVAGATRLIGNLVKISAEFEKQRVSLHAILQDANGAERIFAQIKELAVQSPFQFKDLVTYTKQLSAFSIPMNELYDTTKMLADVSAGLGVGMDRLVLAYGQIRSASFLRGQEVRQLTEAGIPILEELRKQFEEMGEAGITAGEVFDKISSRQVTFQMVEKVFKDMTSEGGKFYKMQEVLAETLSGKISNLTDAYQIMFAEIGEKTNGILVGTVDTLRSIADNYEKIGKSVMELVAAYGVYRGTMIALEALNGAFILSNHKVLQSVVNLAKQMKTAVLSNPYALLAAGATAAAFAIYKVSAAIVDGIKTQTKGHKILRDYTKGMDEMALKTASETAQLDRLYAKLLTATEGTEEYAAAKKSIMNQYDTYIQQLRQEGKEVDDLVKLYDSLKKAVQDAAYDKYRDMLTADAKDAFENAEEDIMKAFNSKFTAFTAPKAVQKASATQREALWLYVTGARSAEELVGSNLVSRPMLEFFKYLRNQYKTVSDAYTYAVTEVDKAHTHLLNTFDDDAKNLHGWQKTVMDTLSNYGDDLKKELGVDASSNWAEYVDNIQKKYRDLNVELAKNTGISESSANANRKELEAINALNNALSGRLLMEYNVSKTTSNTSDDRVKGIEEQIKMYQKLKKAYADLTEYISDSEARDFLSTLFPEEMALANFDAEIRRLAASLLTMGEAGVKAAAAYDELFKEDELEAFKRKLKQASDAAKAYEDAMEVWSSFVPSKDGIAKIVSDYEKALAQIEEARTNAMEALYEKESKRMDGMGFGAEFFAQKDEIDVKAFEASSNELVDAREKAEQEIERIYNSWLEQNTKFGKLTDLSLRQLNDLKTEILGFNIGELPAEQQELFAKLIPQVSELNALLEKFKKKSADAVDDEKQEDSARAWKQLAKNIVSSSKALKEFASASNNYALEQLADTISVVGGFVQDVADGFMKAGEMGAVVAGVTSIANFVLQAATRAAQLRSELGAIARDQYFEAIDERIEAASGIFGNSWMGKVRALRHEIQGLTTDMRGLLEGTMYQWEMYAPSISLIEALKRYADELGMELYDANGFYNAKTLEAIQKKYEKAFKARGLTDMLTQLTEYNDKMKELFKEMESSISEMFDTLGGDIADSLIESLKATGSAVTDLEDVFQNLGDSIFKSMVQSYIIDDVLNKYKDEVKSWWTDETLTEADIANRMRDFANSVKADIDFADDRLTAMYNAFMENSLLTVANEAEDKSNLGGGVKSITEDTANLLASYINAIRADVSAIRQKVVGDGVVNVPAPTLAEYLTQIQANTYNNAQNTAAILDELRSVMTMSDGPAFRVFM